MITFTNLNTGATLEVVPSSMTWSLQDVSAADSGRDATGTMYKNMVTKKRKLELKFNGWSWQECSALLQVVDSEYFIVQYPDMLSCEMEERTFYAGDRSCPVFTWWDGQKVLSSITFNCIER